MLSWMNVSSGMSVQKNLSVHPTGFTERLSFYAIVLTKGSPMGAQLALGSSGRGTASARARRRTGLASGSRSSSRGLAL